MSENEKAIVVGDVVRLKSGGPMMTVTDLPVTPDDDALSSQMAACERFNERNKLRDFTFPIAALEVLTKYEPRQCTGGAGVPWDMPLVVFVAPRDPASSPESSSVSEKPADSA